VGRRFDWIVWNNPERAERGPKGAGQDARSNPAGWQDENRLHRLRP
jgi:hypothetical protein